MWEADLEGSACSLKKHDIRPSGSPVPLKSVKQKKKM